MDWLLNGEIWVALLTLATLEIVLGIDNLVFISIAVSKLPPHQRPAARKFGLMLACVTRILLLVSLAFLARMQYNLFSLFGQNFSIRDLVLIGGGLFLLIKGTLEIHDAVEGRGEEEDINTKPSAVFGYVIAQIAIIDIVFSLDSVITAVGMVNNVPVMIAAIIIAVGVMIYASNPIGDFIEKHPTVKMLALAFIILVGVALVADGFEIHINRSLLYF
ncbi:MAG TPA: TerC family protein, partial [Arenimonas sp.]|nr:TerC family protein [Arenimonas sp.]